MPTPTSTGLHLSPPTPSLGRRLWAAWCVFWSAFFTITMSPLLVAHSAIKPTALTLRSWMRPWGRFILGMWGIRVRVEQRAPLPDSAVVFVSNHVNSLDIPIAMLGFPRPFLYVARREIRDWPVVGWVLEKSACLFIHRNNPRQSVVDLRRVVDRLRGGDSILLYPEGGRSHGHRLAPFMRGPFVTAIEAGVPIVPVTLVGHAGLLSRDMRLARPGETRFILGAPIPTDGLTRADASDLMERVRGIIEAELAAFGPVE